MAEVTFGEWLRRQRKSVGFTQEQLAQQVGCSTITLRKIEAEERRPSSQIVERFADIFNIAPNDQASFLRFARGDWKSAPASGSEAVPWRASATTPRSNVPAPTTSLIGREQEIASIHEYFSNPSIRLVTLIGPPGIGKTRLSIELAHTLLTEFPDGVFFITLAPLEDPSLISASIVQTLGYREAGDKSAAQQLIDSIGEKQILLVLDNCEHLIQDVAPLVSSLLSACGRLKILATSRESLRVPGEWLYAVPAFDIPRASEAIDMQTALNFPALTLFAERARAVRPDFGLNTKNIHTVSEICAQLDGLPLAIELIAARMRLMSPESLLARLNDQFILQADGMRALSSRQKTLNNAIRWSYDLLSIEEQKLFAYLSVFAGSFTLDAAEAIFSQQFSEKPVSDLLTSLLDKSLLQRLSDIHSEVRFHMLVTIQHFAWERLRQMDEEATVRNQHLRYFLALAWQADKEIHSSKSVEWLDRLEIEHDNFRTALDWCLINGYTEHALHLIGIFNGLGRLWSVRNYFSESRQWFEKVRTLPNVPQFPIAYATALNGMSFTAALQGDYSVARSMAEESQDICQALGREGERTLGGALFALGLAEHWSTGNLEHIQSLYEQAAAIYQARGNDWERAFASFRLGVLAVEFGNYDRAQSLFEDSLVTFETLQDAFILGRAYIELGSMYKSKGEYERARKLFEQALIFDRRLRFPNALCTTLTSLGSVCRIQNDYDQAEAYLKEALSMSREFYIHDYASLFYLGCVMLYRKDFAKAAEHFISYLKNNVKIGMKINIGESLFGLAAVAAARKEYQRAILLAGAGQAVHDANSYKMPGHDLVEIDPLLQIARKKLGDVKFDELVSTSRAMTINHAIAYALEEQGG